MAHVYGHRERSEIGPWMRNLWDKLPDFNLGGLSPTYGQFAPQTREEYEAQRNRPMFDPTGKQGRASLRQVAGDIAGAGQAGVMLAESIQTSDIYRLEAIFDDDLKKKGNCD